MINSDSIGDCDLSAALKKHRESAALATMVLIPQDPKSGYSTVEMDERDRIVRIAGNPSGSSDPGTGRYFFAGIHVLEPDIFAAIPSGKSEINSDIYPRLITAGRVIKGFVHTGFWKELGNPRLYLEGSLALLRGIKDPGLAAIQVSEGVYLDRVPLPKEVAIEPPALIAPAALAFLKKSLGSPLRVAEIAGDASTRRFFRVSSGKKTAVLIVHPEPLNPAGPLFSNHRVLASIGAPVPRILGSDPLLGLVLTEDLGDVTLQKHLLDPGRRRGRSGEAERLYREACDLIVLLHRKGQAALRPDDFAATCALDCDRFLFELDHFHRHYIIGYRKMPPGPDDERVLRAFYSDLAAACDR